MNTCFLKKKPLGAAYRKIYLKFREYLFVGGMPAPLSTYLKTNSLIEAEEIKREIIELYRDDFAKQKNENPIYVASIFDMIPSELSNHDKRFKYTLVVTIMLLFISIIGYSLSFFYNNNSTLVANIKLNDLLFNIIKSNYDE